MVVARLSTFALAAVMARGLGPHAYGRYGLSAAISTMVVPLADAGLTPYLVRETARATAATESAVPRLVAAKLTMSAAAIAVVAASWPFVEADRELMVALLIVLTATLAESFSNFVFGYFQGRERMTFEAVSTAAAAVVRSVGGVVLVWVTGQLVAVLAWILVISLVQMAHASLRFRAALRASPHRREGGAAAGIAWRSALAMGLVGLFARLYLRADSVIIGWVIGERAVGLYTAAYTFVTGLQILPWMISVALVPVFARTHGRQTALFARSWHQGMRAVMLLSLPLALVTTLLGTAIMVRLFGAQFAPAGGALAVLVWSSPIWGANMILSAALRGARRESWLSAITGVGTVLNIALNVWLIPAFGITGAAAVTVATESCVLVALGLLASRRRILPWPRLPYMRIGLSLAVLAVVALATRSLHVEIAATGSLSAYIIALIVTRALTREDLDTLKSMVRRTT